MTTRAELKKLFVERPSANFGIITGAASRLIVLDVDGPEGEMSLDMLEEVNGSLPKTVTVRTGRGRHLYFRTNAGESIRNTAGKLGIGLDVRGNGGYVVGVGSIHPGGAMYRYATGFTPKDVAIAEAPAWLEDLLAGPAPEPTPPSVPQIPKNRLKAAQPYAQAAQGLELERLAKAPIGQRNETLNICAFRLGQFLAHSDLLPEREVIAQLTQTAKGIGLDETEIERTILSGLEAGKRAPRDLSNVGAPHPVASAELARRAAPEQLAQELSRLGETDADNAERLAKRFGRELLFNPGLGFLVWGGTHWCRDTHGERYRLAQQAARLIAEEAPFLGSDDQRARRQKFAQQSLGKGPLDRMLDLAKPLVAVEQAQLDAAPMLLPVWNGTVDLRTGTLEAHDPRDLITKVVPVAFDATAKCPRWKAFIRQATGGDRDLGRYLQRAVGYTLTGNTGEQKFFLIKGPGGTGKGVFVNTIRDLLAGFGQNTPFDTFLVKAYASIPADLAALRGARMVVASESNFGQQIDEAKIKAFTGGDPITARFLHGNFFTFRPVGKLWLVTNDFPRVRSTSDAFWRRVQVISFPNKVTDDQKDTQLEEKLRAEFPGILAWAVRGCQKWLKDGLGICPAVEAGSQLWQKGADHFIRFANECLVRENGTAVSSSNLYSRYTAWCLRNGEEALSVKALHARMVEFDVTYKKTNTRREWRGIRFAP